MYTCTKCGSVKVMQMVWWDPNERKVDLDENDEPKQVENENGWCDDCGDYTVLRYIPEPDDNDRGE